MSRKLIYLLLVLSLTAYLVSGYYLKRENFWLLITLYSILFATYFLLLRFKQDIGLFTGLAAGLICRFVLLFSVPALSDDFYRFLWDGRLQHLGINPFDYLPSQVIAQSTDGFLNQLYPYLNSPDYFSVYPQLLQYIFWLAVKLGGENLANGVIALKGIIFIFECGSIYLLIKLLKIKLLDPKIALIYILNPLVIIELTGNIHFEAIMIFFILLSAYLLEIKQLAGIAGALTMAIQSKLIPVIAIPLLIKKFGRIQTFFVGLACLLLFWISSPYLWGSPDKYLHFFSSLQLYYGKFEFNGSIYSVLRGLGFLLTGFNLIEWISKLMILLTIFSFLYIYRSGISFLKGFYWLMVVYLIFSAVVHPWYLAILVALSPFVSYRFALIWAAFIPLSYITYASLPYSQNYWLIGLEYLAVASFAVYESRHQLKNAKSLTVAADHCS